MDLDLRFSKEVLVKIHEFEVIPANHTFGFYVTRDGVVGRKFITQKDADRYFRVHPEEIKRRLEIHKAVRETMEELRCIPLQEVSEERAHLELMYEKLLRWWDGKLCGGLSLL